MGLYDTTITAILKIVTRPDARTFAEFGLKEAILFLHRADKFPRDMKEQYLVSNEPEYEIKFTLPKEISSIEYIRPTIKTGNTNKYTIGPYLTMIDPSAIYGINGSSETNFWYISHNSLNVRSTIKTDRFILGYYANPNLTPAGLDVDWIMEKWNDLVILLAVSNTFRLLRNWAASNTYNGLAAVQYDRFRMDEKLPGEVPPSKDDWGGQGC